MTYRHKRRVNNFAGGDLDLFEDAYCSFDRGVLDPKSRVGFGCNRFFVRPEVIVAHRRYMGLRGRRPVAHGVRKFLSELLHGSWRPAIRVTFPQNRVNCGALNFVVSLPDSFIF